MQGMPEAMPTAGAKIGPWWRCWVCGLGTRINQLWGENNSSRHVLFGFGVRRPANAEKYVNVRTTVYGTYI